MQKRMLPLLLIPLIFLCSCKGINRKTLPLVRQIQFTAQTVWDDDKYLFNVVTDNQLNATVTVQSPETIKGLKITFSPKMVKTQYSNIETELPFSAFSENSPFSVVYHLLLNADNLENSISYENSRIFCESKISGKSFKLYFTETGLPLKAESPDRKILFKSISILK